MDTLLNTTPGKPIWLSIVSMPDEKEFKVTRRVCKWRGWEGVEPTWDIPTKNKFRIPCRKFRKNRHMVHFAISGQPAGQLLPIGEGYPMFGGYTITLATPIKLKVVLCP
jgi:hypothetical protein